MKFKKLIAENLSSWEKDSFAPPVQLSIRPTDLCNLRCKSCWLRNYDHGVINRKTQEISDQKLYDIVEEAAAMGVKCVEITGGGEPFARKTLTLNLIKQIKNHLMIGWMTTNGTLFSEDIVKLMVELGWDKLTVSLDGPDAKTNDFLRPPSGSFDKVMNGLNLFNQYKKKLQKELPEITLNVVVSDHNVDRLAQIISLAARYNVQGVTFEPIKVLAETCKELMADFGKDYERIKEEFEKAKQLAAQNNIFTNIEGLMESSDLIKKSGDLLHSDLLSAAELAPAKIENAACVEPWFHVHIEADGEVRPCCVAPNLGESINDKTLKEIWFGEKFSSVRKAILNRNYPQWCNQCNANLICFSKEIQELFKQRPKLSNELSASRRRIEPSKRKKIKVVVSDTAPLHPPLWGGPKRIWGLFSNFSEELFDLTYVGTTYDLDGRKYQIKNVKPHLEEILCVPPAHYYLWRMIEGMFFKRKLALDLFFYLGVKTDVQLSYILNSQDADVVICSHPWTSPCIDKKNGQIFIYDAHNCEYLLMEQILKGHPLRRLVLKKVFAIEKDACKKSDLILACSKKEKEDLAALYHLDPDKIILVNNGTTAVEEGMAEKKTSSRQQLSLPNNSRIAIFVGAYYKPNNDAVEFVARRLAPSMKDWKFVIVGTVCDFLKERQFPENVILLGKVPEDRLALALSASDIALNPMSEGSGINIKMLDYMAYGLPIVTTDCGARGIETLEKKPMIVSALEHFEDNIRALSNDGNACARMSADGRALIAERYDWKKISENLQEAVMPLLREKPFSIS